jgi:hypothetical protein
MSSDSDSDIVQDLSAPKSSMPARNIKLKSSSKNELSSSKNLNKRKLKKIKEENRNFLNSQTSLHLDDKEKTKSLYYDPKLVNINNII